MESSFLRARVRAFFWYAPMFRISSISMLVHATCPHGTSVCLYKYVVVFRHMPWTQGIIHPKKGVIHPGNMQTETGLIRYWAHGSRYRTPVLLSLVFYLAKRPSISDASRIIPSMTWATGLISCTRPMP